MPKEKIMQLSIETNKVVTLTRRNSTMSRHGDSGNEHSGNGKDKDRIKKSELKTKAEMARAEKIYDKLQDSIHRIIDKIISFNSSCDREDYMHEAFLACVEAVRKYSSMRTTKINSTYSKEFIDMISDLRKNRKLVWMIEGENKDGLRVSTCKNEPKMKPEVFAYWLIEKKLFRVAARSNEVVFNIYNEHGEYERTVGNSEYRKIKKTLEKEGRTVKSDNIFRDISFSNNDEEENGTSHEVIDANFTGFNPEVKEMLKEDMNRFYKGVQNQ
jgi:hypothetical protein